MDTGKVSLTPAERKAWREVLPHFETVRLPDGWLRFTCARCKLAFSYAGKARSTAGPLHLKAHLARHGVHFAETARAKRAKKPGARALGGDRRPRQEQFDLVLLADDLTEKS